MQDLRGADTHVKVLDDPNTPRVQPMTGDQVTQANNMVKKQPEKVPDAREQLRRHFNVPYQQHNDRWDNLWKKGDCLPFDRGQPNPALIDTLNERQDLLGKPLLSDGSRRKRALVPGCGRGYDVLLLASFGYDAYGLEVSADAVKSAEAFAQTDFTKYTATGSYHGCGTYKFILGDFFDDKWQSDLSSPRDFDLIYDYTFLCALPPEMRPAWAGRITSLLAPGPESRLLAVEFPTYKSPDTGGPPFGLSPEVYVAHLSRPGEDLPYEGGYPNPSSYNQLETGDSASNGSFALARIGHWQPERTHPIGKGTDWVSVWRHA